MATVKDPVLPGASASLPAGHAFVLVVNPTMQTPNCSAGYSATPARSRRGDWIFVIAVLSLLFVIVCAAIVDRDGPRIGRYLALPLPPIGPVKGVNRPAGIDGNSLKSIEFVIAKTQQAFVFRTCGEWRKSMSSGG